MREEGFTEADRKERALLLGVDLHDGEDFARSMEELKSLAEACGMEAVGQVVQNLPKLHHALYMGKWTAESFGQRWWAIPMRESLR